jgi:hypothetical protein
LGLSPSCKDYHTQVIGFIFLFSLFSWFAFCLWFQLILLLIHQWLLLWFRPKRDDELCIGLMSFSWNRWRLRWSSLTVTMKRREANGLIRCWIMTWWLIVAEMVSLLEKLPVRCCRQEEIVVLGCCRCEVIWWSLWWVLARKENYDKADKAAVRLE